MKTPSLLLSGSLALVLVACSGSGAGAPPDRTPSPTPTPVPTQPDDPGRDLGGNQGGGTDSGIPGNGGIVFPNPDPGMVEPGEPQLVEPVAGARMIRDTAATDVRAAVVGRRVTVQVAFWGGVEPCHVLAGVDVARDGNTITITVKVGAGPEAGPDIACIEIAVLKATTVDLGELDPGTYTIVAVGDAAPIEVVVP